MAKRRMPPRYKSGPKKGQFMSRRARSAKKRKRPRRNIGRTVARRNQPARKAARRRPAARARRPAARARPAYRPNPRRPDIIRTLIDSTVEAGQVLIGKAAVRTVPDLVGFPASGNTGIAIQAGTALVIGFVADMFLRPATVRALTAGALTAPLETLIVANDVPWLARALSPVTAQNQLGAYVQWGAGRGGGSHAGVGRYVRRSPVSRLSTARGMGNGNYIN